MGSPCRAPADPAGTPFADPAGSLSPIPQGPRRSGETSARRLLRVRRAGRSAAMTDHPRPRERATSGVPGSYYRLLPATGYFLLRR